MAHAVAKMYMAFRRSFEATSMFDRFIGGLRARPHFGHRHRQDFELLRLLETPPDFYQVAPCFVEPRSPRRGGSRRSLARGTLSPSASRSYVTSQTSPSSTGWPPP